MIAKVITHWFLEQGGFGFWCQWRNPKTGQALAWSCSWTRRRFCWDGACPALLTSFFLLWKMIKRLTSHCLLSRSIFHSLLHSLHCVGISALSPMSFLLFIFLFFSSWNFLDYYCLHLVKAQTLKQIKILWNDFKIAPAEPIQLEQFSLKEWAS